MYIEKQITKNKLISEKMNIEKRKTNQLLFPYVLQVDLNTDQQLGVRSSPFQRISVEVLLATALFCL